MKKVIIFLMMTVILLSSVACKQAVKDKQPEQQDQEVQREQTVQDKTDEDFSFSLTFGTNGISSYDSKTGTLIKSDDEDNVSDYTTTLTLTKDQLSEIYDIIYSLDIESYPDDYDPINDPNSNEGVLSSPSRTLILTVKYGTVDKTVSCMNIIYEDKGYNDKAQAFLDACAHIRKIITESEEWLSLPELTKAYI